jgi:hypothetical protein
MHAARRAHAIGNSGRPQRPSTRAVRRWRASGRARGRRPSLFEPRSNTLGSQYASLINRAALIQRSALIYTLRLAVP